MSWTYDATKLNKSTEQGRVNIVRLTVGDTNQSNPLVQDEEIKYVLAETNDNVHSASATIARILYTKFAQLVNTELDEAIRSDYSDIAKNYKILMGKLEAEAKSKSLSAKIIATGLVKRDEIYMDRFTGAAKRCINN